jgi:L-2-hydroxyglutarate oxidase LhgO
MSDIEYAIVGGGAIGLSIAYALSQRGHDEIFVLERSAPGRIENQSTRNSGVIHAGIYYRQPEQERKARLCVLGNDLLYQFCRDFEVPHARTGKLVVATSSEEEERLRELYRIACEASVPDLALLSAAEARALEPNVRATLALHVPSSGVIDAASFLRALQGAAPAHHLFATEVVGLKAVASGIAVRTRQQGREDRFVAKRVINAAGLYADEVARLLSPTSPYTITPVRGEAAKFYTSRRPDLAMRGMNVYPLPRRITTKEGKTMETLGVHLTPTLDADGGIASTVTIGPAIRAGVGKEDYGMGLHPPEYYWQQVRAFFPSLCVDDIELHQSGIQARCPGYPDWIIEADPLAPALINLIGVDSPGLTASLAIANYVVDELLLQR